MRGLRRLAATLGVVAMGAACGPGATGATARPTGVRCDPVTLAPDLDQGTFETNMPNLFLAGGAVAGAGAASSVQHWDDRTSPPKC